MLQQVIQMDLQPKPTSVQLNLKIDEVTTCASLSIEMSSITESTMMWNLRMFAPTRSRTKDLRCYGDHVMTRLHALSRFWVLFKYSTPKHLCVLLRNELLILLFLLILGSCPASHIAALSFKFPISNCPWRDGFQCQRWLGYKLEEGGAVCQQASFLF